MTPPDSVPILRLERLGKSYAVPVLKDVDLDVRPGEVHALVGANGAGKSTLARIVAGLTKATTGSMQIDGTPYSPTTKLDAEASGVQIVMQELNLVNTLSVAENLFLNRLPNRYSLVAYGRLYERARTALDAVGLEEIDPAMSVEQLGVGHQQLVEIAAALSRHCRLLILDEPTAALTDPQIELLFTHINRLRHEGVGILYISHRMDELRRISDRITILRDGQLVATVPTHEVTMDDIVRLMVGEVSLTSSRPDEQHEFGPVALRVEHLNRSPLVQDVSFDVRHGEVFGLAGLVGSGRTETLRTIFGADPPESGRVCVGERLQPVSPGSPRDAVRAGIGMIPEDRKQQGLLLPEGTAFNITLASLKRMLLPSGRIDREAETRVSQRLQEQLAIQATSLDQPTQELSGGNQQKVVIARWLLRDLEVLLFDEPTRGIDIAARQSVYHLLRDLARQGKAQIVVSSDLAELMSICDRIGVLSAGRLVKIFDRTEWTHDALLSAAFSGYLDSKSTT